MVGQRFGRTARRTANDTDSADAIASNRVPIVANNMFNDSITLTVNLSGVKDGFIKLSIMILVCADLMLTYSFPFQVVSQHILQDFFAKGLYSTVRNMGSTTGLSGTLGSG